jgi:hypothetical protein
MRGTETTIIRWDGDNYPLSVCVETGRVERRNSHYPATLKGEVARCLFLDLAGITPSADVPALIRACNRTADRKTLTDADSRRVNVSRLMGWEATPVKSAKRRG